jgi:phosphopantothenoylcysteine decarboxylase/phosphopantothenate--cysteine ligase
MKAAAVADYRPRLVADQKLKRSGPITLELEPTEDIVKEVVRRREPGTLVIAFAAETEDLQQRARAKLEQKGVDAIIANDVSQAGLGFDSDRNAAVFITRETAEVLPESSKRELAEGILDRVMWLRDQTPVEATELLLKR